MFSGPKALVVRMREAAESIPPETATTALDLLVFLKVEEIKVVIFSVSWDGFMSGRFMDI